MDRGTWKPNPGDSPTQPARVFGAAAAASLKPTASPSQRFRIVPATRKARPLDQAGSGSSSGSSISSASDAGASTPTRRLSAAGGAVVGSPSAKPAVPAFSSPTASIPRVAASHTAAGAESGSADSSSRPKRTMSQIDAVCRVQALVRGKLARLAVQKQKLLVAWHELDRKEEEELQATHGEYAYLKTQVGMAQIHAAAAVAAQEEAAAAADADSELSAFSRRVRRSAAARGGMADDGLSDEETDEEADVMLGMPAQASTADGNVGAAADAGQTVAAAISRVNARTPAVVSASSVSAGGLVPPAAAPAPSGNAIVPTTLTPMHSALSAVPPGPGFGFGATAGLPRARAAAPGSSAASAVSAVASAASASLVTSERSGLAAATLLTEEQLNRAESREEYADRVKARLMQLRLLREFRMHAVPHPAGADGSGAGPADVAGRRGRSRRGATMAAAGDDEEEEDDDDDDDDCGSATGTAYGADGSRAPSLASTVYDRGGRGLSLDDIFSQEFWSPGAAVSETAQFRDFLESAAPRLAALRRQAADAAAAAAPGAGGALTFGASASAGAGAGVRRRRSSARSGTSAAASATAGEAGKHSWPRAEVRAMTRARPIDAAWVAKLTDELAAGRIVSPRTAERLVLLNFPLLAKAPNVQECKVARNGKVTVVGDLHGQLADLLSVFKLNGHPSPMNQYIFNGDWVDRGAHSCECLLLILAWKLLLPHCIFLNRGNHEAQDINSRDGFEAEVLSKYSADLFALFSELFACAPLGTVICASDAAQAALIARGQILPSVIVLHGGLPANAARLSLRELNAADRFHVIPPPDSLLCDVLWSDPGTRAGSRPNPRGAGVEFGPDVTAAFLARNNFCMLVRSHECMDNGWGLAHNNLCATVFSASNYCGVVGNQGAYAVFEGNLRPTFVTYYAQREVFSARTSTRYRLLEQDVVRKLMNRVAMNRLDLIEKYAELARWNREKNPLVAYSDEVVTRKQWADGLTEVLGLNIPFLLFQEQLGLPDRGVLGDERGPINYMTFLAPFQPSHTALKAFALPGGSDTASVVSSSVEISALEAARQEGSEERIALQHLAALLFAYKYELQSVFRFFDHDCDDAVSIEEFASGLLALMRLFRARARLQAEAAAAGGKSAGDSATASRRPSISGSNTGSSAAVVVSSSGITLTPPTFATAVTKPGVPARPTRRAALSAAQQAVLNRPWTLRIMRRIARLVDLNGDGEIQYSEFFAHFDYEASGASKVLHDKNVEPLAAKYRAACPSGPQITSVVRHNE